MFVEAWAVGFYGADAWCGLVHRSRIRCSVAQFTGMHTFEMPLNAK
jgi:hypothetical protein